MPARARGCPAMCRPSSRRRPPASACPATRRSSARPWRSSARRPRSADGTPRRPSASPRARRPSRSGRRRSLACPPARSSSLSFWATTASCGGRALTGTGAGLRTRRRCRRASGRADGAESVAGGAGALRGALRAPGEVGGRRRRRPRSANAGLRNAMAAALPSRLRSVELSQYVPPSHAYGPAQGTPGAWRPLGGGTARHGGAGGLGGH
mmetsp:Transcript_139005/g.432459  ORF Transcript_139005/g.432459 Transcript_139005/m.432459 type:complete len:210 (+) Transcript_139005:262-891(+)